MVCPCCAPGCECRSFCHYDITSTAEEPRWTAETTSQILQDDCDNCGDETVEDSQPNPLNEADQVSSNALSSNVNLFQNASAISGGAQLNENYASLDPFYNDLKTCSYGAQITCATSENTANYSVSVSYFYVHSKLLGSPATRFQETSRNCLNEVQFSACPPLCNIVIAMTPDGFSINGDEFQWECSTDDKTCTDYDENGDPTPCNEFLDEPLPSATFTLACREECEFP
jgi:hypothetical protein